MQLIKNYIYNIFYQVFIIIVPLITMPYISRVLGPTGSGINSLTNANTQYFILFGSIGVALYGNRQVAYLRDDKSKVSQTFWEIFIMRLFTISLALVAFYIFVALTHTYQRAYLMQSISIIAAAFDVSWFFMGVENFRVTVLRNVVVKLFSVICIFTLVKTRHDVALYIFILSMSQLLGNIVLFPYLHTYLNLPNWQQLNIWQHLLPSIALFIPQIALQIYLILNKTMLGLLVSVEAAGFYNYADNTIRMLLAIVTSLSTVMMPRVANTFAQGNIKKVNRYTQQAFDFSSAIAVPLMFGIAGVSLKLAPLFFGSDYNQVSSLLMIESLTILPVAWSSIIGNQYLLPLRRNQDYTFSVTFGAILSIIFNIPLILFFNTDGAMISSVICEWGVTIYQLIRKKFNLPVLFIGFWKYFISGLIMFLIVFYLHLILSLTILTMFFEIVIGMIVYFLGIFLLKAPILEVIKQFFSKTANK
ncbi:oligosaccharide flippase family protein [Bombilactobacillus bombi]|uniref:oligosaccharide flippase family protein n=1 Tax=Bombilactobacillus bombi TaxID=1303590 RepID=UPI0015E59E23|nr:oligosaccharide flippase family protein [Bombilactobacillus bombi]MBA1435149.1 flippase [Bombilactobacillus bombi]